LVITALTLDFLQYAYQTAAWGIFSRIKERHGTDAKSEFLAPGWLNRPALVFFVSKVFAIAAAYVLILLDVARRF
jgi:hypothetical protein